MFETFGIRRTLWLASLLNLLVAVRAGQLARAGGTSEPKSMPLPPEPVTAPPADASVPFVLPAAGVSGFVFFLMELVWYRMLGPSSAAQFSFARMVSGDPHG